MLSLSKEAELELLQIVGCPHDLATHIQLQALVSLVVGLWPQKHLVQSGLVYNQTGTYLCKSGQ